MTIFNAKLQNLAVLIGSIINLG